jgi:two-component system sensor histidine kinase YesM
MAISSVGVYSYSLAANQVTDKVKESQLGLVKQVTNNLDLILTDVKDISSFIIIDDGVQAILQKSEANHYPNSLNYLDKIISTKNYISMIALYGYYGLNYSIGTSYTGSNVVPFQQFRQNPIFQKAEALNGNIGVEPFTNTPTVIYDNRLSQILMYRVIKEFNHFKNVGVLLIWLNEPKLRSIYNPIVPKGGSILIVAADGAVISSSNSALQRGTRLPPIFLRQLNNNHKASQIIKLDRQRLMLTDSISAITGWKVIVLTPVAVLTEKVASIAFIMLMAGVICYILLLFLSAYISSIITDPIRQLQESIKKVQQGDFSQQVSFSNLDEIGELGQGYNTMINHIRNLIDRVYKLQIQEREAELIALQAQINPHFLYNTLDTIFWKAEKNNVPEISEMVYALAKIFRLSLNRGDELTTVAKEQELIGYYLKLQQIRFQQKFSYTMDCDPQLLELSIPKLVLQPFVENAIIHGIGELETGGRIDIIGWLNDSLMIFTITDNGIGMSDAKIEQIINNDVEQSSNSISGGYAIRNVIERLELYYNSDYQLTFNSTPGIGTTVTIIIPQYFPAGGAK